MVPATLQIEDESNSRPASLHSFSAVSTLKGRSLPATESDVFAQREHVAAQLSSSFSQGNRWLSSIQKNHSGKNVLFNHSPERQSGFPHQEAAFVVGSEFGLDQV
jgi:hypothetical protein